MKFNLFIIILLGLIYISCKHKHPEPSDLLKESFEIQKKTIKELSEIEVLISGLPDTERNKFTSKKVLWQSNMIEIEGMQHDHSQCDGDHSKKRFTISDEDMLAAQSEWRDSIMALKVEVTRLLDLN